MNLLPPALLTAEHGLEQFQSGVPSLDEWLRKRALANQISGASRTFVVCDGNQVVGYYALASGAIDSVQATGRFRRNMPNPIPVVLLARLAVDQRYQGQGFGRGLFKDVALRTLAAAEIIGVRGLMVHALSADAERFYLRVGFEPSPIPLMLMMTLADIRLAVSREE